jgi:hypothetical protein
VALAPAGRPPRIPDDAPPDAARATDGSSAPRAPRRPGPTGRPAGARLRRGGASSAGGRGMPVRARRFGAGLPSAASFFGTDSVGRLRAAGVGAGAAPIGPSSSARGRHSTTSFPIACTSAAPERASSSVAIDWRASRSSPKMRTLISPCAPSARSVSAITASVRPSLPIMTTGSSSCARARKARRSADDNVGAGAGVRPSSGSSVIGAV